jgi:hypothetical protein
MEVVFFFLTIITNMKKRILVWHRDPPSKKTSYWKMICFLYSKNDICFRYQKLEPIWRRGCSIKNIIQHIWYYKILSLTTCVCFFLIPKSRLSIWLFFYGGPRCHIDTCYWYPKEDVVFWNTKSKSILIWLFLGAVLGVRLDIIYSKKNSCVTYL